VGKITSNRGQLWPSENTESNARFSDFQLTISQKISLPALCMHYFFQLLTWLFRRAREIVWELRKQINTSLSNILHLIDLCNNVFLRWSFSNMMNNYNNNSVVLVRERTIPIERPPIVGEVSANLCGERGCRVVRDPSR
jgi:hypothetical protein